MSDPRTLMPVENWILVFSKMRWKDIKNITVVCSSLSDMALNVLYGKYLTYIKNKYRRLNKIFPKFLVEQENNIELSLLNILVHYYVMRTSQLKECLNHHLSVRDASQQSLKDLNANIEKKESALKTVDNCYAYDKRGNPFARSQNDSVTRLISELANLQKLQKSSKEQVAIVDLQVVTIEQVMITFEQKIAAIRKHTNKL